jgi:hypothetical protein
LISLEGITIVQHSNNKRTRERKCKAKGCGIKFVPSSSLQHWCSPDCGVKIATQKLEVQKRKQRAKATKAEKQERKKLREVKQRSKSLQTLCAEAQVYVNQQRRLEDEMRYGRCISCNGPIDDAGHYHAVGSKNRLSRLRFHPSNINGQCMPCNRFVGGGNKKAYAEGYAARYGLEALNELDELQLKANKGELEPLTKNEVVEIKRAAQAEVIKLKIELGLQGRKKVLRHDCTI